MTEMQDDDIIRLSPGYLWQKAADEHPDDPDARRERHLELMRKHGHIVPVDHPDAGDRNLPCGWPGRIEMAERKPMILPRCGRCADGKHSECEHPTLSFPGSCCCVSIEEEGGNEP